MSAEFTVRRACIADAEFISIGIREAERCHVGIGIFDLLVGKSFEDIKNHDRSAPDETSAYLKNCVLNDPQSHVTLSNFLVAEHKVSGKLAACACSFPYPTFSLSKSIPGFKKALQEVLHITSEVAEMSTEQWAFLDMSFPEVDWSDCWMIEAVYVSPDFRGCGLGETIVGACVVDQTSRMTTERPRRVLLTCAVGNDAAKHVYEKLGFTVEGQGGPSDECMRAIRCSGFYVLSKQQ
jgi:GNAT superfamily N-acetyltransferase